MPGDRKAGMGEGILTWPARAPSPHPSPVQDDRSGAITSPIIFWRYTGAHLSFRLAARLLADYSEARRSETIEAGVGSPSTYPGVPKQSPCISRDDINNEVLPASRSQPETAR